MIDKARHQEQNSEFLYKMWKLCPCMVIVIINYTSHKYNKKDWTYIFNVSFFLKTLWQPLYLKSDKPLLFSSGFGDLVEEGNTTDDKTNRWSSAYMSLSASYFAVPLVAVRLNYRTVTNSCVFTGHFIQNILHFGTIQILLFISDELFLCITFPKCNFYIYVVIFLSTLDSTISTYKCLVTCELLRVTESHCC